MVANFVDSLRAEHGFSVLMEVERAAARIGSCSTPASRPDGLIGNLDRLGIAPDTFEAVVLSATATSTTPGGWTGLPGAGPANLPVVVHPVFWTRRRIGCPGAERSSCPHQPPGAGGCGVRHHGGRAALVPARRLAADHRRGRPDHRVRARDADPPGLRGGDWEPDPLILDDQAAVCTCADKGLVVLTGCGHAGIVNILRYARQLTGVDAVYAVMGGLHLTAPFFEPIIPPLRRAGRRFAGGHGPRPLHRLEGRARYRRPLPWRLSAKQRRHPLRALAG